MDASGCLSVRTCCEFADMPLLDDQISQLPNGLPPAVIATEGMTRL